MEPNVLHSEIISFIYSRLAIFETYNLSIWREFKRKYPQVNQNPMELKLLFHSTIMANIVSYNLTDYQRAYFNQLEANSTWKDDYLLDNDPKAGVDFETITSQSLLRAPESPHRLLVGTREQFEQAYNSSYGGWIVRLTEPVQKFLYSLTATRRERFEKIQISESDLRMRWQLYRLFKQLKNDENLSFENYLSNRISDGTYAGNLPPCGTFQFMSDLYSSRIQPSSSSSCSNKSSRVSMLRLRPFGTRTTRSSSIIKKVL